MNRGQKITWIIGLIVFLLASFAALAGLHDHDSDLLMIGGWATLADIVCVLVITRLLAGQGAGRAP